MANYDTVVNFFWFMAKMKQSGRMVYKSYICIYKNLLSNIRESWNYKVYFLKLHKCAYLTTKFQVSSILLTQFVIFNP